MLFNDLLFILTMGCGAISSLKPSSSKADQENILYSTESIDSFIASRDQGTIYFASTNHLISVSPTNFSILNKISLGPVRDSPWCDTNGQSCLKDNRPSLTDVHTKILHYLPSNQILQCGSVKLGSCSIYNPKLILVTKSNVSVAAIAPEASTVSQIMDNRLVVAATATEESPYRDPFPSVSIRELPGLNVENAGDLNGEAAVFLRPYYRGKFRFVEIFSYENFVFVVATVTLRDARSPVTTRLIRFCKNDTKFASYSEIELQCRGEDNTNYPFLNALVRDGDKMVASFTVSTNSAHSSICIFSMQKVKLTFWYNLDKCRSGADSIKLPHIGRDAKCVNKAHIPLDENSCELGVGGSIELVEISVKNISSKVTSLMSIDQKVVFAGTSSSQILLLKWNDSSNPISLDEYGRKEVGNMKTGHEVQKMVRYGDNVLIQMKYGIIMKEISKCADHKSCTECLFSVDPLCRWCHPTQSCTTSSTCVGQSTLQCPSVEAYPIPSKVSVNTTTEVFFKISHLPPPVGFIYECQFGPERVVANWNLSGLSCSSGFFGFSDVLEVSLMTSLSKKHISRHNITVFDCSDYATCSQCIGSNFGCHWCSRSHECSKACSYSAVNTCIKIQPMKLPLAIGSLQEIVMEATNLDTLDKNVNHFCKIEDQTVPATIAQHSFRCGKIRLMSKSEPSEIMNIPLSLMAGNITLEVTNVSLYSCSTLASDCSSCRALQPSLSCSWCNQRCSHECEELEESIGCDPPRIDKFEPSSGPVEGGTIIRIYGNDLGTSLEDVQGKIYVAGSKCNLVKYQVSNMIECQVDRGVSSGPIRISVGRATVTVVESQDLFSFVPVSIFSAYPLVLPINGGNPLVTVIIGSLRMELGLIEYSEHGHPSRILLLIFSLGFLAAITVIIACFLLRRKKRERAQEYHKIKIQMDNLEKNVRKECKQAFAELQTNLALSPKPIGKTTQPEIVDFSRFMENLLWAENTLTVPILARTLPMALAQFHALLSFKEFIFTIVDVAESRNSISTSEKSMLASLLISVLIRNFSYCTEIVISLLKTHIAKAVENKRAELLFRNSDSLVEMMISKWWCICLYPSLKPQMNSFYNLYKALQFQTDRGPVDAVTGDARYTINEANLLRECVETRTIIVNVIPLENCHDTVRLELHSCDAIRQVKQKVAAAVYYKTPYSQRPRITQFDLRFKCPRQGEIRLVEFRTLSKKKLPVKLLTISDYDVQDGSILEMTPAFYALENHSQSIADSETLSCTSVDINSPAYSFLEHYHLVKSTSGSLMCRPKSSTDVPKSIPEVYLTRLLTSKGTVEAYIEDFFESVLYMHAYKFPPILKYVFDTLDHEAEINEVEDNISHQWKANGFVLRVWANFIKNPQLALDLPHSISMDANLSIIAQTMIDCFSFSEPVLSAQSPSSRLLFAKDVARLRPFSADLLKRIKNFPSLSINELEIELDLSTYKGSSLALSELLSWVRGNAIRITEHLSSCEKSAQQRLPQKLSDVLQDCHETDNHIYSTISDYE
ncbi:CBN-PLX-2 protein [Caenorhabditis brenneri]|uniref:CBN-PLX-2 protein n=1 Tax=Caenorhabditis brenneri TaxID=135651 RepID=G0P3N1_CAEBE|nr:CBN-PLX-2 protein [Caenorhabditis brenneri]